MTKPRAPFSFERALARIAGLIGWAACAETVRTAERTVRAWSDPDCAAGIRMDQAVKLDARYRAAGGDGFPLLECYTAAVDAEALASTASAGQLLNTTIVAIKEGGDAHAALVAATRPGATDADFAIAEREVEEAQAALTSTLGHLRAGRGSNVASEGETR